MGTRKIERPPVSIANIRSPRSPTATSGRLRPTRAGRSRGRAHPPRLDLRRWSTPRAGTGARRRDADEDDRERLERSGHLGERDRPHEGGDRRLEALEDAERARGHTPEREEPEHEREHGA